MKNPNNENPFDIRNPRLQMEQTAAELAAIAKETTGLDFTVDEIAYTPEALNAVLKGQAESQAILDAANSEKAKISNSAEAILAEFLAKYQSMQ